MPNRQQTIALTNDDPILWHKYASPGLNELNCLQDKLIPILRIYNMIT